MAERVAQGGSITLRAVFRDGTGALHDPVDPRVDIIDPLAAEVVTNDVPVRDAVGQFHYEYVVDNDAILGLWTIHWTGVIRGTEVGGSEQFEVVVAGVVSPGPSSELLSYKYERSMMALRDWFRTDSRMTRLVAERTYVGARPAKADTPCIVLHRIGGGADGVFDAPLVQVRCMAPTGSRAEHLTAEVMSLFESVWGGMPLTPTMQLMGASVTAVVWQPDPSTDLPSYVMTVEVWTRSTP